MNVIPPYLFLLHVKLFALTQMGATISMSHVAPPPPNASHLVSVPSHHFYNGRLALWLRGGFWLWGGHGTVSKRIRDILRYLGLIVWFKGEPATASAQTRLPMPSTNESLPGGSGVGPEDLIAASAATNVIHPTDEQVAGVAIDGGEPDAPRSGTKPVRSTAIKMIRCNSSPITHAHLSNMSLTNPFPMNATIYTTPFSPHRNVRYRPYEPEPAKSEDLQTSVDKERANVSPAGPSRSQPHNGMTTSDGGEHCVLHYFYRRTCPYSANLAPEINALPRMFPQVFVLAVEAKEYWNLSLKYGFLYVPNLFLLKGDNVIAKLKGPLTTDNIATFLTNHTNLKRPVGYVHEIREEDYVGPISTKVVERGPVVSYLCWSFILFVLLKYIFNHYDRTAPLTYNIRKILLRNRRHLHAD